MVQEDEQLHNVKLINCEPSGSNWQCELTDISGPGQMAQGRPEEVHVQDTFSSFDVPIEHTRSDGSGVVMFPGGPVNDGQWVSTRLECDTSGDELTCDTAFVNVD